MSAVLVIVQLTSESTPAPCLARRVDSLALYSTGIFCFPWLMLSHPALLGGFVTGGIVCKRRKVHCFVVHSWCEAKTAQSSCCDRGGNNSRSLPGAEGTAVPATTGTQA